MLHSDVLHLIDLDSWKHGPIDEKTRQEARGNTWYICPKWEGDVEGLVDRCISLLQEVDFVFIS